MKIILNQIKFSIEMYKKNKLIAWIMMYIISIVGSLITNRTQESIFQIVYFSLLEITIINLMIFYIYYKETLMKMWVIESVKIIIDYALLIVISTIVSIISKCNFFFTFQYLLLGNALITEFVKKIKQ